MAIDTAEKRKSAGGVAFLPLGPNVTPNAAKDAEWRAESGWAYSGIPYGPPTPPTPSASVGGGQVFIHHRYGVRDYYEGVLYWLQYGRKQGEPFTPRERALLQQARLISDDLDAQIDDDWMLLL